MIIQSCSVCTLDAAQALKKLADAPVSSLLAVTYQNLAVRPEHYII